MGVATIDEIREKINKNSPIFEKICNLHHKDLIQSCEAFLNDLCKNHPLLDNFRSGGAYRTFDISYISKCTNDWVWEPNEIIYKIHYYDCLTVKINCFEAIIVETIQHCSPYIIHKIDLNDFYNSYIKKHLNN